MDRRPHRSALAALILANLALALGPWLVRMADTGPVAAGFWRLALAIPFIAWFAARRMKRSASPGWVPIVAVLIGGLFFAADLGVWHVGILKTSLANATLFANSASFLFAIYGFLIARALPHPVQLVALLAALAGTALLMGRSLDLSREHLEGDLLTLLAGFFYTFYLVAVERARRLMDPWPVLFLATLAGCLPLLLVALALGEQIIPGDWTPVILLAMSSQVLGQGLLIYAMGHLSPLVIGIGLLTQPIVAATVGWLAYDERLGTGDVIGALLICAALVLIRWPDRRLATIEAQGH